MPKLPKNFKLPDPVITPENPLWIKVGDMHLYPRGWYWGFELNAWVWWAPHHGKESCCLYQNKGYFPPASTLYWGPWPEDKLPPKPGRRNLTLSPDTPALARSPWLNRRGMALRPAGWYWATYPGDWVYFDPKTKLNRGLMNAYENWCRPFICFFLPWTPVRPAPQDVAGNTKAEILFKKLPETQH